MCCRTRGHHSAHGCGPHAKMHHGAGNCGCGGSGHSGRRFLTTEEQIAQLEQYRDDLQQEAQAVAERIAALQTE